MDIEGRLESILEGASELGFKLLITLPLLILSFKLINLLTRKLGEIISRGRGHPDKTVVSTLSYVFRVILKLISVILAVQYLGVDTSGITALVASLGVGIGLAVNGALSNLAGGVLLIFTRPFSVDDYIEAEGYSGTVEDIRIVSTRLRTPDNRVVYIPNGSLCSATIVNYSEKELRRVDIEVKIANEESTDNVRAHLLMLASENPSVLDEPCAVVLMTEQGESYVTLVLRAWCKGTDFWDVKHGLTERIRAELLKNEITPPHNRLDVYIKEK